jgi:CheY-like chemotaxis protein
MNSTVLVVDDDPGVRRLSSMVLRSAGFEVRSAENGREALLLLVDFDPAVVVLDLQMPVMDGRSFFRAIEGPARPPVLLLSAYEPQRACDELGAEACLAKPFDPDDLIEKVSEMSNS